MPKIYISPSNQTGNVYAFGNTNEQAQCEKIAAACALYLKRNGFNVLCTYNQDMYERVKESNEFNADLHVAIHTNATVNHNITGGTQILLYKLTGENKKVGDAVLNRLAPLTPGSSAERLIEKPDFFEIRNATGITVYCECEFHDTVDGAKFIINHCVEIGESIARGICDYYGITPKEEPNVLYRVQVGAFSNRTNAETMMKKLQKAGFTGFIVKGVQS